MKSSARSFPADFGVPRARVEGMALYAATADEAALLTALPQNDGATVEIDGDPAVVGSTQREDPSSPVAGSSRYGERACVGGRRRHHADHDPPRRTLRIQ